jgi:uroporphyrinogen-III synthase
MSLKILITRSSLETGGLKENLEENSQASEHVGDEAELLAKECRSLGWAVKICPIFYLNPSELPLCPLSASSPVRLTGEEDLIFVTRLAVDIFKKSGINLPQTSRCFAVGEGTAKFFKSLFFNHNIYYPAQISHQNSEGLLALSEFDFMAGRKVFIFRGDSGREYLADELRARGAVVEAVHCYERKINPKFHEFWTQGYQEFSCDIVVLTSTESLKVFLETPKISPFHEKDIPWITVLPGRMEAMAREYGYPHLLRLETASNVSIMKGLRAFIGKS